MLSLSLECLMGLLGSSRFRRSRSGASPEPSRRRSGGLQEVLILSNLLPESSRRRLLDGKRVLEGSRRRSHGKKSILEGSRKRPFGKNRVLEGSRRRSLGKNSVLEGSRTRSLGENSVLEAPGKGVVLGQGPPRRTAAAGWEPPETQFSIGFTVFWVFQEDQGQPQGSEFQ